MSGPLTRRLEAARHEAERPAPREIPVEPEPAEAQDEWMPAWRRRALEDAGGERWRARQDLTEAAR